MTFSLDISDKTRSLVNLEKHDIIEFESEFIDRDIFMVLSIDVDDEIPAILLQLWKFRGGYNHAMSNVMENDLGLNQQVPYFDPKVKRGKIIDFINYRPKESGFSQKEEYFFDLLPDTTTNEKDDKHTIPFEVLVQTEDDEELELIVPTWTPLQKLPYDRLKKGTIVEIYQVKDITNIMRVLKL